MFFSELVLGDRASAGAVCVREADGLVECAIMALRKLSSSFGCIETILEIYRKSKMMKLVE